MLCHTFCTAKAKGWYSDQSKGYLVTKLGIKVAISECVIDVNAYFT